jgi:hypothetical protein
MLNLNKLEIIANCKILLDSYKKGLLNNETMPEDTIPGLNNLDYETKLVYFTLPMSLNYQRNSYKLWECVLNTYLDKETKDVFSIYKSAELSDIKLRSKLTKYKIALQPNKHINTWKTISTTIFNNWGTISNLLSFANFDFLKLKQIIQKDYKKGFPYLSGPKIFNYWCYILIEYCNINLKNKKYIDIAPDTHVIQASVKLKVLTKEESTRLNREQISNIWKEILKDTNITPIQMHSPLWFWSKNNFKIDN